MAYPDLSNYKGTVDPAAFRQSLQQAGIPVAGASSAGGVSYGMQAPAKLAPVIQPQPVIQQQPKPVTQPVQPVVQANPSQGNANAQNYINQLIEMQKQAAYAALGKSRDAALSNLNQEKAAIQPKYYDARNQVAAGAQQQARNFAEYMAARGGTTSGTNAQAQLMNNVATQGNLGALGRQEAQAYTDIARRGTDVNNAYQSDMANASAGLEGDKLKLLLQDFYNAQQRGDTQAQRDIQNALQQAQFQHNVQQDTFNNNRATANDTANYTGYYQNPQTALIQQQMQRNSQAWFNATPQEQARLAAENQQLGASIGATQDAQGNWVFPQAQQTLQAQAADLQRQQIQQQLQSGQINNEAAQFKLDQLKDPNSPTNQAAQLDLQIKQLQAAYLPQQQKLQLQQLQKQIAQIGAAPYRSELDKQLDQVKLDTAKEQLKLLKNPQPKQTTPKTAEDYSKIIDDSIYLAPKYDNNGIKRGMEVVDPKGLEKYILSLNLPDKEAEKLYRQYNLNWGG